MKVKDVGERKLIELLLKVINKRKKNLMGYDDVVAYPISKTDAIVVKTDSFIESTDLLPNMKPEQIGRKLVVMNVSDFAAKGVMPLGMLISLVLPDNYDVDYIVRVYNGAEEIALEYGFDVMGGDTSYGRELMLSGFLFGFQHKGKIVRRDGARVGDYVATTGVFGDTSVAFSILFKNLEAPDENLKKHVLKSVYEPRARLKEGLKLAENALVTASIDSSDGLAISLYEIAESSDVGILVENIPLSQNLIDFCEYHGLDPIKLALYEGGEEFELIVTIPPQLWHEAKEIIRKVGGELHCLGRVVKEKGVYLKVNREKIFVEKRGWEHFRGWV